MLLRSVGEMKRTTLGTVSVKNQGSCVREWTTQVDIDSIAKPQPQTAVGVRRLQWAVSVVILLLAHVLLATRDVID